MSAQIDWTQVDVEEFEAGFAAWCEQQELKEHYWFVFDPGRPTWLESLEGEKDANRNY